MCSNWSLLPILAQFQGISKVIAALLMLGAGIVAIGIDGKGNIWKYLTITAVIGILYTMFLDVPFIFTILMIVLFLLFAAYLGLMLDTRAKKIFYEK